MTIAINLKDAEKVWYCDGCGEVIEEPITLYECGACGMIFSRENSADGNSHTCPECQKFASKLTAHGCGDCEEACVEVMAVEAEEWVIIGDAEVK